MTSIYKSKEGIKLDGLRKLLPKTNTQVIGDNLPTKSTIQERKKMRVRTKERRKFLTNNQKHLERKQNPRLQFRTFPHHRNRRIESHYKNSVSIRRRINNIHVENHELSRTELWICRKRNVDHHSDSQEIEKIF